MITNDSITSSANGIAPIVLLASLYDSYLADPANNGDDSGFFSGGNNNATITSADFTRVYPVSLASDTNEDAQHGTSTGMVTTRGQLSEILAVASELAAGQTSNGIANLYSGDGQYILNLTVLPTA
jgi:hypothetical protein